MVGRFFMRLVRGAAVWAAHRAWLPEPPTLRAVLGIGVGIGTIAVGHEVSDARGDEEEVLPQLAHRHHCTRRPSQRAPATMSRM